MNSLSDFLPEEPQPVTTADVDRVLRMFFLGSFKANPGFTKEQHIDYATQATSIYLNIDDSDLARMK